MQSHQERLLRFDAVELRGARRKGVAKLEAAEDDAGGAELAEETDSRMAACSRAIGVREETLESGEPTGLGREGEGKAKGAAEV